MRISKVHIARRDTNVSSSALHVYLVVGICLARQTDLADSTQILVFMQILTFAIIAQQIAAAIDKKKTKKT